MRLAPRRDCAKVECMLTADDVRALIEDNAMSDEEAFAIRDACYELAAIIVALWTNRQRKPRAMPVTNGESGI